MRVVLLLLARAAAARLPAGLFRALCEAAAPPPLGDASLRVAVGVWRADPAAARRRYGPMAHWNVSRTRDFSWLLCGHTTFNEPIGRWDTRNAHTMRGMFCGAVMFDHPLFFNTRHVRDMANMFCHAHMFNHPLRFDTRHVRDMSGMFVQTLVFNQPIPFDTQRVRFMDFMFYNATAFNQPLADLDMRRVVDQTDILRGAVAFAHPHPRPAIT